MIVNSALIDRSKAIKIPLSSIDRMYTYKMYSPSLGWNVICCAATILTLFSMAGSLAEGNAEYEGITIQVALLTYLIHVFIFWGIEKLFKLSSRGKTITINNNYISIGDKVMATGENGSIEIITSDNIKVPFFGLFRIERPKITNILIFNDGEALYHLMFLDKSGTVSKLVDNTP